MVRSFFWSRKWFLWAWGGVLLLALAIGTQVYLSVKFNAWYGRFYNILGKPQEHTVTDFYASILEWVYLAVPYVLILMATNFFARHYAFRWRKAMTFDYLPRWEAVEVKIEGASQRIQEDTKEFGEILESLGLRAMRAVLTLIAFIPVLWSLSVAVTTPILSAIPGSLVWIALVSTLGGLVISWFVGWFLPKLEYNNQRAEAAWRKHLVLAEDDRMLRMNKRMVLELFTGIEINYSRLFLHYGYFDLWVTFYDLGIALLPDLLIGPSLFTGAITLGVLMQVNNAFLKVWGSFSFIVDNWTKITRIRSIFMRLKEFESALDAPSASQAPVVA